MKTTINEIAFRAILKDPDWVGDILDLNPEEVKKIYNELNLKLNPETHAEYPFPERKLTHSIRVSLSLGDQHHNPFLEDK